MRISAKGATRKILYVRESSRSIQERAAAHWRAANKETETIHMHKHQLKEHKGEPPLFHFKVISYHRKPLSRQIKEAVRIWNSEFKIWRTKFVIYMQPMLKNTFIALPQPPILNLKAIYILRCIMFKDIWRMMFCPTTYLTNNICFAI